jgi:hypothetical protein
MVSKREIDALRRRARAKLKSVVDIEFAIDQFCSNILSRSTTARTGPEGCPPGCKPISEHIHQTPPEFAYDPDTRQWMPCQVAWDGSEWVGDAGWSQEYEMFVVREDYQPPTRN